MIRVTCAVIRNEEDEVLVVQRGEATDHPFKWEFPGGKIAEGENEEDCILREVKEELSMEIVICYKLPAVEYDYGTKQIFLIPFICDTLEELPFLSEHLDFKWVKAGDLKSVDLSEADVFVAASYLQKIKADYDPEEKYLSHPQTEAIDDAELQTMINNLIGMKEADWLATSAIENPEVFQKLLEYSHSRDKKLAFHASWILTKVCDKFPEMIYPFLSGLVDSLNQIDNESTLRSFLRIISFSDIGKVSLRQHGVLADHCFNNLKSGFSAIAVKAYSMEILYKLVVIYPELGNELSAQIHLLQVDGSAGIKSRGQMILKKLAEISIGPRQD